MKLDKIYNPKLVHNLVLISASSTLFTVPMKPEKIRILLCG
jgi:hypothetical protein